jgi:choline dehydrogenase
MAARLAADLKTQVPLLVDRLRIADASILPRVTTGNTMAPCVVIGERAADVLRTDRKL